ncbi:MAG: P1 family peptidase [Oscillospiraceae bacterium]|jgi:L-aminopeptidase/D-esterase-like protein|nr:P1 family peptidase [Oscillospiraceae bacterium]
MDVSEIPGFRVGQARSREAATGCTVVISERGAVCGVDVSGGSPGTRDTAALDPVMNRKLTHAVLLTGGSSFGLDAAGGVMRFLEERGIGRDVGVTVVPNVAAAVLFDLKVGGWDARPDAAMGYAACGNAFSGAPFARGQHGAGTGCAVGKCMGMARSSRGGVGSSVLRHGGLTVGAVAAVNCVGDVVRDGGIIAGLRGEDGGFADSESAILEAYLNETDFFSENTVLACVMTNARLDKAQATRLARCGQNGIARCIRPAHSVYDGDTVFAMCSGELRATLDSVCILAARAVESAIYDAVTEATA